MRPPMPEYKKYYIARVEGRGRNKDQAEYNHGKDLEYTLFWIRGEVVDQTELEIVESFDNTWLAVSTLTFKRKEGKVYRR